MLSLILALLVLVCCFFACDGDKSDSDGDGSGSEGETVEIPSFEETGILTVFANDEYHLKMIRSETANSTDKEAYVELRELLSKKTGTKISANYSRTG